MATNYKGQGRWNWRNAAQKPQNRGYNRPTNRGKTIGRTNTPATGYSNVYNQFQQKISSYRTLCNQMRGPAKVARPTQATLNTFANWINKGANIYTITPTQLNRWAGKHSKYYNKWNSVTVCKSFLTYKWGKNTIKAVTRTKNGYYMVACAPTYKGKPFNFPK
jgi:hypothetical protein